jgi:hypothetical protein
LIALQGLIIVPGIWLTEYSALHTKRCRRRRRRHHHHHHHYHHNFTVLTPWPAPFHIQEVATKKTHKASSPHCDYVNYFTFRMIIDHEVLTEFAIYGTPSTPMFAL